MTTRKWSNDASKENGKLGGEVMRQRRIAEYLADPKTCKGCPTILPWGKHGNSYCSRSCGAKHSNSVKDYSKIKPGPSPKPKEPRAPYSTLFKCVCKHCKLEWRARRATQVCEEHAEMYSHAGRARFWFTFGISSYPDLFDGAIIREHGMRSRENPNGVTRDHRVSVQESILNGYDPYYIKHPLNCELMLFDQNNKKKTKSSMSYEDLVAKVKEYDKMVGRVGV
jgi:hypothetical protein